MTHQPPVPKEATSPYPLQPPPVPDEVKRRAAEADAARAKEAAGPSRATIFAIGAAIVLGAAAAVSGMMVARRRPTGAAPGGKKRKKGKASRGKAAKARR